MNPNFVQETAVQPKKVILCLLSRHDEPETVIVDVGETAVIQAILQNSLYVDQPQVWQKNVENLQQLLVGETAVALKLGRDHARLVQVLETLSQRPQ